MQKCGVLYLEIISPEKFAGKILFFKESLSKNVKLEK